jgi:hypothetical protein
MKHIYNISLLLLLLAGCETDDPFPDNADLIFPDCYPIVIPSYDYLDPRGKVWHVRGDSVEGDTPDTVSAQPVFIWENPGISIIMVAVFRNPIDVTGGEITNVSDIVWQWHSGMPAEKNDTVQFYEGSSVTIHNGIPDYGVAPDSLDNSSVYYWAVWGWGRSGTRVLYSSRQLKFHVSN